VTPVLRALVCVATVVPFAAPAAAQPAASNLERAQALLEGGRPDEAVPLLEAAVAGRPGDGLLLGGLASAYSAVRDPRAEATFERAIAAEPRNIALRLALADHHWRARQYDKGNAVLERAIAASPDKPRLQAHYGVNLYEQRRFGPAARELDAARRGGLVNADVLFFLGSALWEVGQLEEAEQNLVEAARRAPENVAMRQRLARLLLLRGKSAEAAAELSAVAKLAPNSPEVIVNLGRALEAMGKTGEAEAAYRRGVELAPDLSVAHYMLGTLLARTERREEAARHIAIYQRDFQKEQERNFREASLRAELNLGRTQLDQGKADAALLQFARHPENVEALEGAAAALSKLNRRAEAIETLERALRLDPENRALRYKLSRERDTGKAHCGCGRRFSPLPSRLVWRARERSRSRRLRARRPSPPGSRSQSDRRKRGRPAGAAWTPAARSSSPTSPRKRVSRSSMNAERRPLTSFRRRWDRAWPGSTTTTTDGWTFTWSSPDPFPRAGALAPRTASSTTYTTAPSPT
jgi:tetratricopeptide (TPR) repeat protein